MGVPFRMDPTGNLGLPAGYRLCEYLESNLDGTFVIDTGIDFTDWPNYQVDGTMATLRKNASDNYASWWSTRYYSEYVSMYRIINSGSSSETCIINACAAVSNSFVVAGVKKDVFYNFSVSKNICIFNGTSYDRSSIAVGPVPDSEHRRLLLFNNLVPSDTNFRIRNVFKCKSFKVYHLNGSDKELLLNFIPALDPSGTPCMFDTVTQKPFYNAGTGTFQYALASTPPLSLTDLLEDYSEDLERRAA